MEISFWQWKMACSLTVRYKIYRIIREMLASLSCLVVLVKIHTIFRIMFLHALTYNMAMSWGAGVGSCNNFDKRSNSLPFLFKNCLQFSPLKVGIGLGSVNIFRNTLGDREIWKWSPIWTICWFGI